MTAATNRTERDMKIPIREMYKIQKCPDADF